MKVCDLRRGVRYAFSLAAVFLIGTVAARAQATGPAQRIAGPINESARVTLSGNTHPLAKAQYDQGAVPDSQPLHRMLLLLQRSQAQETALRGLLDQQQSKASPNFHQWLTPQQFGAQFGPADSDVQTVTAWLASHGFQVARVSAGKTIIEFSGTAGQVRQAFQTEIHRYVVNGEEHFANASDPSIPAALAPVVAGTVSLHNFPKHPQSRIRGLFRKDRSTGKVTPQAASSLNKSSANPSFNFASDFCSVTGDTCYALGPADWATIYNVPSTVAAAAPGTGQTIAIVGDSEICTANSPDWNTSFIGPDGNTVTCNSDDVATFRSQFGLPANTQTCPSGSNGPVCVILDGPDSGFNGDETEGDLDTEWAGAVARNATEYFVVAEDTETTFGTDLAAEYVVDNELAPVLSESFGECELFLLTGGNTFENDLWEQAAAEGISVVVSAGDSGSAGCDDDNTQAYAEDGAFVNGIASTPFNVAAGGADFDIAASGYPSSYWNSSNNGTTGQSAKSYIPETTWNDSCAQNFTGSVSTCLGISESSEYLNIVGGGGGQSNCISSEVIDNGEEVECTGSGYSKPAWQSGYAVTGSAASDNTRDLPDISFFAADGLKSDSFYIICEADLNPGGSACNLSAPYFDFVGVGGTSSAAPTFAGTMALVNQAMTAAHAGNANIPERQGNPNYVLYQLASSQVHAGTACSSTAGPNAACTFNDIIRGNDSVPCLPDTYGCSSTSEDFGVVEQANSNGTPDGTIAWNTGTGFDLATGLGTINVGNLVGNWSNVVGNFTATTTSLQMCGPATCTPTTTPGLITVAHGTPVNFKIGVAPTSGIGSIPSNSTTAPENAALIVTTSACTPNNGSANNLTNNATPSGYSVASGSVNAWPLTNGSTGTVSTSYLVGGGTYYVKAHYAGDGTYGASDSNCIEVDVTSEASTTTLTVPVLNLLTDAEEGPYSSASAGTIQFGDVAILRADVKGSASGQENANTGTVTFKTGSTTLGTVNLNTEGYAEMQTGANVDGTFMTPLPVGSSQSITATYNGGNGYSASPASAAVTITVNRANTASSFCEQSSAASCPNTPSSITVSSGQQVTIEVLVDTYNNGNYSGGSYGTAPTGTVTFHTTANVPPAPLSTPRPNVWILIAGLAAALGLLFQFARRAAAPRRRLGTAVAAVLLTIAAAAVMGCGSGSSSTGISSGGGGGTGTAGTGALVATTDAHGFVAATATLTFNPTVSQTITATYPGDTNYKSSSTSTSVTINVE